MSLPRTVLVTGANRGLGRSAATALAARGHRVVVGHRPSSSPAETLADITAAGGQGMPLAIDIADTAGLSAAAPALRRVLADAWATDRLDVLVNNAGVGVFGSLDQVTTEDFDRQVGTVLRGTFFAMQSLVPLMGAGGLVINVSSSLTRHSSPGTSVYTAAKAGVEALGRSLALELGPRGIRVIALAPGPTETDFNGGAMRDDADLRAVLASSTALGRVGRPSDIAGAIAALVGDDFRWVTGERIEVSGGAFL